MDVPRLYRDSDLFVFPSIAESFGHPLVEAMASGLPILASDIPVCREICGEAAIYFDPFDEKSLAQAIVHLAEDTTLRKRLSEAGRRRAVSQFNWTDHVRRLVTLIEEVGADA
jgi:glycosyltransferase involved in cell wall biosynthesis